MDRSKIATSIAREPFKSIAIYVTLALIVAIGYSYAVRLIAVQTPWINVVMGKATANIVLLLILWVIEVERVGKRRSWSSRKVWILLMLGVLVLLIVVKYTPV